jgi:hypothetical protein
MSNVNEHQFGEMQSRLSTVGGFTYDPRKRNFVTSGYSVAAHKAAEMKVPLGEGGAQKAHLEGYVKGSAPIWQAQKGQGRGQEMIGGWRSDHHDVIDLPKVFPATPTGHQKSRQAQILRNEQASYSLHEGAEDTNPWFTGSSTASPGRLSQQFPEFSAVVSRRRDAALDPQQYPEIAHWSDAPVRQAGYEREATIAKRRASGT